jgi:hypothetical protein
MEMKYDAYRLLRMTETKFNRHIKYKQTNNK